MINNTFIIVPVYNEQEVIGTVLQKIKKFFLSSNIICVDDGSSDNSVNEIIKEKVVLLRHIINLGQGAAIHTGIQYALKMNAKYFVTFDSDGQHSIVDAKKMLNFLVKKKLNIVLGSRFLKIKSKKKIPILRSIILFWAIKLSNLFYGIKLSDTHNGLRVFDFKFAKTLKIRMIGMSHPAEFVVNIKKNKFFYAEYPTNINYTKYSISKGQANINSFNILFDMLINKIKY